jgi:hypothetical protein
MNKPTLANLYRQATREDAGLLPDADTLVALANGERPADAERIVAEIAQSALQSDLLHFTRALEPASSALRAELAATFGEDHVRFAHARVHVAPARVAAGRWRNLRRVGLGLAAAMIAAVAIWSQQHALVGPATVAKITPSEDRIFAAFDERAVAKSQHDEIFNGSFKGDVIFRSSGG